MIIDFTRAGNPKGGGVGGGVGACVCSSRTLGFLYDWLEERLEIQSIGDDILAKFVPPHVNIFYCFGGLVLTGFLLQTATGLALTMFYKPSVTLASGSVRTINHAVNLGWAVRSLHRWTSSLVITCLCLHISRVFTTGGFKKPRELIWISGLFLAIISVSFGVTGYSLPWDQVGYWAMKIVTSVPEAFDALVPGFGAGIVLVLRSGYPLGQGTLTRMYSLHTFILPAICLILKLLHHLFWLSFLGQGP